MFCTEQHAEELAEKRSRSSRTVTVSKNSREKHSIAVLSLKALKISVSPDGDRADLTAPNNGAASPSLFAPSSLPYLKPAPNLVQSFPDQVQLINPAIRSFSSVG